MSRGPRERGGGGGHQWLADANALVVVLSLRACAAARGAAAPAASAAAPTAAGAGAGAAVSRASPAAGGAPPEEEGLQPGGGGGQREGGGRGRERARVAQRRVHCPRRGSRGCWAALSPANLGLTRRPREPGPAAAASFPAAGTRTRVGWQRDPDWSGRTGRMETRVACEAGVRERSRGAERTAGTLGEAGAEAGSGPSRQKKKLAAGKPGLDSRGRGG